MAPDKFILLFDGECNLCNRTVQFVIKHDKEKKFMFASLQSDAGKKLLKKRGLTSTTLETFVLIKGDRSFLRSAAALSIIKELRGVLSLLYCFVIVPAFIRDGVYNFIAKRRYKIFGKASCMVPSPELMSRFLE